ncbi:hypothetical protein GQ42DRAFT_34777 [Ramicandelaber brevisporus]|nr:hypothetical protein GQ42DRAFT_34777 [Ramicandelaber brevisporus]
MIWMLQPVSARRVDDTATATVEVQYNNNSRTLRFTLARSFVRYVSICRLSYFTRSVVTVSAGKPSSAAAVAVARTVVHRCRRRPFVVIIVDRKE